ncbi:MAG: ornithine cyclodeaminase [Armatimonadetes bacterium]|nr:ornithine cyclodeaminase [Armatimonadota bacterium]
MSQRRIPYFSAEDIFKKLPMKNAIEAMKKAFSLLSAGKVNVPLRMNLEISEYNGSVLLMPVYAPKMKRVGLKFLSIFNDNPSKGLPAIQALVFLMNAENGKPLALMDGSYLTALRTGAASGAATDLLARKDSKVVAIFGAGVQGRTQLEAICTIRPIEKAFIFDLNSERAQEYADEMSKKLSINVIIASSDKALKQADVICTATNSKVPVFDNENLKPRAHINAIGAYQPTDREIPAETIIRSKLFVDHLKSCLVEAGDILIPIKENLIKEDHILGEIGDVISGTKIGRTSEDDITLFKSVGNAIQDLVAADEVLR